MGTSKDSWGRLLIVTVGSALFFSWGFLTFLSPSVIGPLTGPEAHMEYAYLSSQLTLVVCMSGLTMVIRRRPIDQAPRLIPLLGALVAIGTLTTHMLTSRPYQGPAPMIVAGIVIGACSPFIGIAWGSRFSLLGGRSFEVIAGSFALSYLLYLIFTRMAFVFPLATAYLVTLFPLASSVIWFVEARDRHLSTRAVWPSRTSDGLPEDPSELIAGDTSLALLDWRAIVVLVLVAVIGNLVIGIIFEYRFESTAVICTGAFTLSLLLLGLAWAIKVSSRVGLTTVQAYRAMLPFTVIGLVALLVSGGDDVDFPGILVMGSSIFLTVFIYLYMTDRTMQVGFSPALTFGLGQSITALSIFIGNIVGKTSSSLAAGQMELALVYSSAVSLILLFFVLLYLLEWRDDQDADDGDGAVDDNITGLDTTGNCDSPIPGSRPSLDDLGRSITETLHDDPDALKTIRQSAGNVTCGQTGDSQTTGPASSEVPSTPDVFTAGWADVVAGFSKSMGLTSREAEIFGHLSRGSTVPRIAEQLYITPGTVKTHVIHIYRKAGVNSRQDLLDLYSEYIQSL
jgi:DNA-binding CsgD family transcriptional regulator